MVKLGRKPNFERSNDTRTNNLRAIVADEVMKLSDEGWKLDDIAGLLFGASTRTTLKTILESTPYDDVGIGKLVKLAEFRGQSLDQLRAECGDTDKRRKVENPGAAALALLRSLDTPELLAVASELLTLLAESAIAPIVRYAAISADNTIGETSFMCDSALSYLTSALRERGWNLGIEVHRRQFAEAISDAPNSDLVLRLAALAAGETQIQFADLDLIEFVHERLTGRKVKIEQGDRANCNC